MGTQNQICFRGDPSANSLLGIYRRCVGLYKDIQAYVGLYTDCKAAYGIMKNQMEQQDVKHGSRYYVRVCRLSGSQKLGGGGAFGSP